MNFARFIYPSNVTKAEILVKMKQKYLLTADFQVYLYMVDTLWALNIISCNHSESQIMFEGFKGPLEVIEAEYQIKIKQK